MNLSTWQQLAEAKSRLLEIASTLIEDESFPREAVVMDLLQVAKDLQQLEHKALPECDKTLMSLFTKLDQEGSNPYAQNYPAASSSECKA